jgi:hypothetical protein
VIALSGYDARKKIKGKRRHVLVDTQGLLMHALVHAGDVQDRDGRATRDGEPFRRLCVSASSALRRQVTRGRSFKRPRRRSWPS